MSETGKPQRTRRRNAVSEEDRKKIAERVCKFYDDENIARSRERPARLQRYAKYRMWQQGADWPWPDASDVPIPDMLQDSLRVQDTLVNAVLSQTPPILANSNKQVDKDKEIPINDLLQHQFFREQPGDRIIGEMAEGFTNDPSLTVFVPWIRERKKVSDVRIFDKLPEDADPKGYFRNIINENFKDLKRADDSAAGWSWTIELANGDKLDVQFYTNEIGEIEMVTEVETVVYNGPRVLVKDYDDVLYPARSANLQPPGPSNPGGAPYVILRDFPLFAEISNLEKKRYYEISAEDLKRLETAGPSVKLNTDSQDQKDKFAGTTEQPGKPNDTNLNKLTRLMCFDTYDIDGDGIVEDVVCTVIYETKTLVRMRRLSDVSPGSPPKRPLFGDSFLPVGGRYAGMSQLEIMEGIHDAVKVLVDQGINANDLAIGNPGWYRPSGGMNPEVLRIEPFTLSPLQNPQQDVVFPQLGNPQAMGFSLNMMNMLGMWQDKTTMVGDLKFGQIPSGASSALRTIGGMSLAMGQGEARPERLLRRFFSILADVYAHMHRLDKSYLPKDKEFRIVGVLPPGKDPYVKLSGPESVSGEFDFSFDANAFNTSKQAMQAAITATMGVMVNPLMIQLGCTDAETVYNLAVDYVKAQGQNSNRYVKAPTPEAAQPRILAEEAILEIMRNQLPIGLPLEPGGLQEHMNKLVAFMEGDQFGVLTEAQVDLFRQYLLVLRSKMAEEAQAQQLQANAAQFSQGLNQRGPGAPAQSPPQITQQPPPVSGPAEMQDERMPTAGGGANNA